MNVKQLSQRVGLPTLVLIASSLTMRAQQTSTPDVKTSAATVTSPDGTVTAHVEATGSLDQNTPAPKKSNKNAPKKTNKPADNRPVIVVRAAAPIVKFNVVVDTHSKAGEAAAAVAPTPAPETPAQPAAPQTREIKVNQPPASKAPDVVCAASHTSMLGVSTAVVPVSEKHQNVSMDFVPADGVDVPAQNLVGPDGELSLANLDGMKAQNIHVDQGKSSTCVVLKGPGALPEILGSAGALLSGGGALAYGIGGATGAEATRINEQTSMQTGPTNVSQTGASATTGPVSQQTGAVTQTGASATNGPTTVGVKTGPVTQNGGGATVQDTNTSNNQNTNRNQNSNQNDNQNTNKNQNSNQNDNQNTNKNQNSNQNDNQNTNQQKQGQQQGQNQNQQQDQQQQNDNWNTNDQQNNVAPKANPQKPQGGMGGWSFVSEPAFPADYKARFVRDGAIMVTVPAATHG